MIFGPRNGRPPICISLSPWRHSRSSFGVAPGGADPNLMRTGAIRGLVAAHWARPSSRVTIQAAPFRLPRCVVWRIRSYLWPRRGELGIPVIARVDRAGSRASRQEALGSPGLGP